MAHSDVSGCDDEPVDFDGAERFLKVAREAHEEGDQPRFIAARKLVAVALGLREIPPPRSSK